MIYGIIPWREATHLNQTTDDQSYLSALAYGYLREATIWVILNQFSEVDAFKDWYVDRRWFEPDEDEVKLLTC